jgi:predicted ArsR family transcriptional regulator
LATWNQRFNESTRGKLVTLLRRASLTVEELAQSLGITDNAVRAQLTSLERDGLVRQAGLRRGAGKPSYSYALTPEFEPTLSRAYIPLLVRLLRELGETMPEGQLVQLLRQVGRRWGAELSMSTSDPRAKLAAASALLNELGGVTEVQENGDRCSIRGYSCPLGLAVQQNPRVCVAVEALLTELLGTTVQEHCDRDGERARCCFEVGKRVRRPTRLRRTSPPAPP